MKDDRDRHFLWHLLARMVVICLSTMAVISVLYMVEAVSAELDPGIKLQSLDVDQVAVSSTHQLVLKLRMEARRGCVGRLARGYVRPTPGVPDSMDIQLVTEAPMPIGLTLQDISGAAPQLSASPGAVNARHHVLTVREFIPSPSNLEPGGGWRFAEFLSQEGCGLLHGLLPVNTTVALGPPIELTAAQ